MTLSYRIIKSEDVNVGNEGVKIASQPIMNKKKEEINTNNNASESSKGHFFSIAEKKELIKELRLEIEEERIQILQETLKEAKVKAEEIKESAYVEGFNLGKEKGYEEGYENGFNEGKEFSLKEGEGLINDANNMLIEAHEETRIYFDKQKANILKLSGKIAERIINKEIDMDSESIVGIVSPVIMGFRGMGTVILSCSSEVINKIREIIPKLKEINEDIEYMAIVNPKLSGNNFIIEYGNQIIDMDVEKQIENIIDSFLKLEV